MNWKEIVKSIAPAIGAALGGPVGGMAVKFLGDALLGDPEATEGDVATYILNSSPETRLKLRTLEIEFEVKMRELGVDVFKIEQEEISKRQASDMASDSWLSKNIRPMALVFLTVTVVILAFFTVFSNLSPAQIETLNMWTGVFLPLLLTSYSFYFGGRTLEKVKRAAQ